MMYSEEIYSTTLYNPLFFPSLPIQLEITSYFLIRSSQCCLASLGIRASPGMQPVYQESHHSKKLTRHPVAINANSLLASGGIMCPYSPLLAGFSQIFFLTLQLRVTWNHYVAFFNLQLIIPWHLSFEFWDCTHTLQHLANTRILREHL